MKQYRRKRRGDSDDNRCFLDKIHSTIYVVGEINHRLASQFRRFVRILEATSDQPILVEINSEGGDIEAGLLMIDTIHLSKSPVTVRVTGVAMSMAAIILSAGDRREATPHSTIMIHQGSFSVSAPHDELSNEVKESNRLEEITWTILDRHTKKKLGYWKARCKGKNLYLTASAAQRAGLVDHVCTKGIKNED